MKTLVAVLFVALSFNTFAAIKIGVDAVKAAIEDEKAQISLAQTLKNVTKATDAQVKATEDYIDKTARATGIADDQLRPSLDRLVRSTQDVTKAQKLQQLALDIAAGTGKDLATVTEALGKAYDGNLGALKRIGVPLDENIIKTIDVGTIYPVCVFFCKVLTNLLPVTLDYLEKEKQKILMKIAKEIQLS